jgi:hypothetical protein
MERPKDRLIGFIPGLESSPQVVKPAIFKRAGKANRQVYIWIKNVYLRIVKRTKMIRRISAPRAIGVPRRYSDSDRLGLLGILRVEIERHMILFADRLQRGPRGHQA